MALPRPTNLRYFTDKIEKMKPNFLSLTVRQWDVSIFDFSRVVLWDVIFVNASSSWRIYVGYVSPSRYLLVFTSIYVDVYAKRSRSLCENIISYSWEDATNQGKLCKYHINSIRHWLLFFCYSRSKRLWIWCQCQSFEIVVMDVYVIYSYDLD